MNDAQDEIMRLINEIERAHLKRDRMKLLKQLSETFRYYAAETNNLQQENDILRMEGQTL